MKPFIYAVILGIVSCAASGQVPTATGGAGATPGQVTPGEQGTIKILVPRPGAKLNTNFVTVNFEMARQASAASSPTFMVRLDDRDPVRTLSTEHTFTGLTPGTHRVTVEAVDANETPVQGSRSQVEFTVLPAGQNPQGQAAVSEDSEAAKDSAPQVLAASFPAKDSPAAEEKRKEEAVLETHEAAGPSLPGQTEPVKSVEPPDAAGAPSLDDLPGAGGHLPLLSLIGFGVLVGGVLAALKNR